MHQHNMQTNLLVCILFIQNTHIKMVINCLCCCKCFQTWSLKTQLHTYMQYQNTINQQQSKILFKAQAFKCEAVLQSFCQVQVVKTTHIQHLAFYTQEESSNPNSNLNAPNQTIRQKHCNNLCLNKTLQRAIGGLYSCISSNKTIIQFTFTSQ